MTGDKEMLSLPIEKALPILEERVPEGVTLMFLVDDLRQALKHNVMVAEGAAGLFCGPVKPNIREHYQHRLSAEFLMIQEMARTLRKRGEALIAHLQKISRHGPSYMNF